MCLKYQHIYTLLTVLIVCDWVNHSVIVTLWVNSIILLIILINHKSVSSLSIPQLHM